ncbi:ATP-binding protein [Sinimarinibacterium sp. NLF-5-8]|uniref:ATP-binding protein n=1 Tax=Sinimarinibacterium sp. NLF-5-8 TaxID=2698684 RepID=UPI00137B99E7|nr:ATP-binding protein [Sinimarinibacterium sp. NLF-5-8]QHS09397.1 ATP-binding protein [Sinimarinibacterium sp. NLF-5-8]
MSERKPWAFYGRRLELKQLQRILERKRWFFLQISGRRRIGKTALIQQALKAVGVTKTLYIQIPDSDSAGVVAACNGYLETFGLAQRITSLAELAALVGQLATQGYVIALDEFQYFHRKHLFDFCSLLQAEVDRLGAQAQNVQGGLIVLGSLHAEMAALLEDRSAPLFNRLTDVLQLDHMDTASVLEMLRTHADDDPYRLLFFWNLFEGVPKFYRDAYEQGVMDADRRSVLERLFFASSSPLRNEADNWFLRELRGRYDMLLQYLAAHPGCTNAEIEAELTQLSGPGEGKQVGGHLKILAGRYRMIERRLPILAPARARSGRYYIRDNFLRAWLFALQRPVSAVAFRPLSELIQQADDRLQETEGHALEALVAQLYEERSRQGLGDFALTQRINGYWDRSDVEIDLVAIDENNRRIRFGSCKRNPQRLMASLPNLRQYAQRFLDTHRHLSHWQIEYVAIAPSISPTLRRQLQQQQAIPQDLPQLIQGLNA